MVYSPYVTARLQPAAVGFVQRFGGFMKWITLEVDLSRLGGSGHPSAGEMRMERALERVKGLVEGFVEAHEGRESTIDSLVVLVRRFYGCRLPVEQARRVTEVVERGDIARHSGDEEDGFEGHKGKPFVVRLTEG